MVEKQSFEHRAGFPIEIRDIRNNGRWIGNLTGQNQVSSLAL
jgi:hypothetical protein